MREVEVQPVYTNDGSYKKIATIYGTSEASTDNPVQAQPD